MHIGFLLPAFAEKGGLERVAVALTRGLSERGHRCTLFYPSAGNMAPPYPIQPPLDFVELPCHPITEIWLQRARAALGASGLDVFCFMSSGSPFGRLIPYLSKELTAPLLWSEHCSPRAQEQCWYAPERHSCMAIADAIHVLCSSYIDFLPSSQQKRAIAIPNFSVVPGSEQGRPAPRTGEKCLLVMARLSAEKQISILLKAFASLKNAFPDWKCRICGEGPQRPEYEGMIRALGLEHRVSLPGAVENVAAEYSAADLFCLPSSNESFGLAVVEAQGFGLPAVGFAECSGVNEVIVHGENGLLAPHMTPESLAQSLAPLMADEGLRLRMGQRARALLWRYDREHVLDRWEELLERLRDKPARRIVRTIEEMESPSCTATLRALLDAPLRAKDHEGWKRAFSAARSLIKQNTSLRKKGKQTP